MYKYIYVLVFFVALTSHGQESSVIFLVSDELDHPLLGATLKLGDITAISDSSGYSTFEVNLDSIMEYSVSYVGYITVTGKLDQGEFDKHVHVRLIPSVLNIKEITISSDSYRDSFSRLSAGYTNLNISNNDNIPVLMGERDPIKLVQLQSGVQSGTDGNSGYYVRGGSIDQNMIRFDDIEIYNSGHLFGFFSMFNDQIVDNVEFYTSGLPASQGRRISSSLQVNSRQPDLFKKSTEIDVGLLTGRIYLERPIVKGKSGLLISGRSSYLDLITQNFFKPSTQLRKRTNYRFNDMVVKYFHRLNSKNLIELVGITGTDKYIVQNNLALSNNIYWGSGNLGLNWKYLPNEKIGVESFLTLGSFSQSYLAGIGSYFLGIKSDIIDFNFGSKGQYFFSDKLAIVSGFESVRRMITPNNINLTISEDQFNLETSQQLSSQESAVFGDFEGQVGSRVDVGIGFRLSHFVLLGPLSRYTQTSEFQVLDTIRFSRNEKIATYLNPEPRLRINLRPLPAFSAKFSYDRNYQYIHLAPVSSVSLPIDVWVPSSNSIRPQSANQYSIGIEQKLEGKKILFSALGYFKRMKNMMEYRNGTVLGYNLGNNYDDKFVFGDGESKGFEFSSKKFSGNFTYQVSYTLSRTTRQFDLINRGRKFLAKYDRTHDMNIVLSYEIGDWTFSGVQKYATGSTLTLPIAKYFINGTIVGEYLDRNTLRLPVYRRTDLSINHSSSTSRGEWTFSIYNLLNAKNPYFVYFDVEGDGQSYSLDIRLEQVSLFPILPSISYSMKF